MSVTSTAEYFTLLKKSGALDEKMFKAVHDRYSTLPDAKQLARKLVDRNVLTDWQARFLLSGRHRLKIGQYKLLNRFSRQVIGDRFLAIHEQLDRKVDVLIFPKDAAKNKKLFQQFLNQASIVAELDHDNLLRFYDIDQENDRYFLVFEHDNGDSLRNVAANSFDSAKIAAITCQALDGIGYAHRNNVIHGKLDESQIRVDKKGRVTIRNIGLGKLLDELQDDNVEADEFDITPDPSDDVVAVGRIAKTLFQQHVGKPITDLDKSLYMLFGKITSVTEIGDGETDVLVTELTQWLEREKLSQPPASPAADLLDPLGSTATTKASPKSSAGKSTTQTAGNKKATTPDNVKTEARKKKALIGLATAAGVAALAGGLWFAMGRGNDGDKTAEHDGKTTKVAQTDSRLDQAAKKAKSDSKTETDLSNSKGFRPNSTPRLKPNARGKDPSKKPKPETTAPKSDVVISESPKKSDEPKWSTVPGAETETETPQEQETVATVPPKRIEIEGAEGLSLVSWDEAHTLMDQEVVLYGKVLDVTSSNSGKTRYISFKKNDRKVLQIVVLQSELEIAEQDLKEKFLDKPICVRGKVTTFRNAPQVKLEMLNQVVVLEHLPDGNTKLVGLSPSSTSTVEKSGVFAGMAGGLAIPELTRNNPNFERSLLGPAKVGEDPLGIFLTVPEACCTRPLWFGIERDQSGRRWEISFAAKAADAEKTKKVVARIHLENDQLFFNWVKTDKIDPFVNYLQNCLLEIKTSEVAKTVILRKSILGPQIVLDQQRPQFKEKIELGFLPKPESISVEILPISKSEFPDQFSDFGDVLTADKQETAYFFDKDPVNQFFRLWYSADISTTIKIESALQINSPGKPVLFNRRNLKSFEQALLTLQSEVNQANAAAVDYQPVRGEKTKHKERLKELSKQLELVNGQVAAFMTAKPNISRIVGRTLKYRVYFTVDDIQFDLVSPNVEESPGE